MELNQEILVSFLIDFGSGLYYDLTGECNRVSA